VRSSLRLAQLVVPATLGLTACRFSYELLDRANGSFGGAGPDGLAGAGPGAGATSSDGFAGAGAGSSGGSGTGGSAGGGSSGGTSSGGAGSGGTSSGGSSTGGSGSGGTGSGGSGGTLVIDYAVTTTADEDDAGATVASPGQSGLSLREAIKLANSAPGGQTIGLNPGSTLTMASVLPIITDAFTLSGEGAILDFSLASTAVPCIHGDASDVSIRDVEVAGCTGEPIYLTDVAATGLEVLGCYVHDCGQPVSVFGVGSLVADNVIERSGAAGLSIFGPSAQVRDNRIVDADSNGIYLSGAASGALLVGNLVVRSDVGISLGNLSGATFWFNTVVDSGGFGISIGLGSGIDFRNNIVTGSGTWGLNAADNRFDSITHNLLFQNTSGDCNSCTPGAPYLTSDPLYVNAAADDYSLQASSPAIDAGVDVGADRNGSGAAAFDGAAPDLGHIEVK